jgi:predicted nucleotidyltransferase
MSGPLDPIRDRALEFTRRLAAAIAGDLGSRLLGVYLIGSLAHGGFGPRYSDIDLLILAENGLAPDELTRIRASAAAVSEAHATKLSVFWSDRACAVGRFPPLDRIDYLDHGVTLIERERILPERPSKGDVRAYLAGSPYERWAATARTFAAAERLEPKDHKPYLRAHLYPARFLYSWTTGCIASNDDAVEFLKTHTPPGLDIGLIEAALHFRRAGLDPDALFAERRTLMRQVEACASVLPNADTS